MTEMETIDIREMPATWALSQSTECERSGGQRYRLRLCEADIKQDVVLPPHA